MRCQTPSTLGGGLFRRYFNFFFVCFSLHFFSVEWEEYDLPGSSMRCFNMLLVWFMGALVSLLHFIFIICFFFATKIIFKLNCELGNVFSSIIGFFVLDIHLGFTIQICFIGCFLLSII